MPNSRETSDGTAPKAELDVGCSRPEVVVGAEQDEVVSQAELDENGIDRSDLNTLPSASVANFGRLDVVFAIGLQERQSGEPLDQLSACLGTREPLQQFLEYQPRREHLVCSFKSTPKSLYGLGRAPCVAPEGQRPNGRVNQQAHERRARSAL